MKKCILYAALGLTLLMSCTTKRNRIEEGAYNPYDTSEEIETFDAGADTVYSPDSLNVKLFEPGSGPSN